MSEDDLNIEDENLDEESTAMGEDVALPEDDGGNVLRNFYADCYVQYASYVVRDRAIPDVDDGLKPVQRRILYCMHLKDDGRFNKVAGVVGDTMHFHPHGDASIYGALVVLANKEFFIDRQGNFGDIITGLSAAAPRYIECRLTQLAKETLFNPDITEFVETYDGRSKEPVRLPAKVPSLLMLGSDGIAVGMSTHIFPHNFKELLEAEIKSLRDEPFQVLPDFLQGGLMDASDYDDGRGKIRVRARIEPDGDKKLIIREVPPNTTTEMLIASIEKAAKRGKVKLAGINDYTSEKVCIEISLQRGIYAEETLKELYAYTDCEKEISSDLLVIKDNVPTMMTVSEVVKRNADKLREYLGRELQLEHDRLLEKILEKTLAQIFVENRIYKRIEKCQSVEAILAETRKGLEPFRNLIHRDITDEDIEKLLQIPIRRISAFDIAKNQQEISGLREKLEECKANLARLTEFTIDYIQKLIEKYGDLFPRRTEITGITTVNAREVARRDVKVFFDKQGHFVGTAVKPSSKDAAPLVLTEFDKIMLLRGDGTLKVMDIPEKEYVGQTKYLLPADKEQVYSILYRHRQDGTWFAKRFKVGQYMLGKEYHIIQEGCIIDRLYTNSGVVLELEIKSAHRRMTKTIKVDFDSLPMRSREAKGFKLTSYEVVNIVVVNKGSDTPAPTDNTDEPAPEEPAAETPQPQAEAAQPEAAQPQDEKPENNYKQTSFFLDE
ncbi:MAG: DNA topoisomerase IV subunit A [Victivallales bacterium]|nr:DNA topoisomerase IV subunit A [Victivallales bacterium]